MSISLDNINFCYQYPPPKPITASRWKPYQVPSTPAHIPHPTCLLPCKPDVSASSASIRRDAPETARSPSISSGGSMAGFPSEPDIGIEGMALAELSSKVSEKDPETHQACSFLDETATDIFWSLSAPSAGASAPEPARIRTSDGDSCKTVHLDPAAVEDVSQKQSDEQASLSVQPATSSDSELVAIEQEVPESRRARPLGWSEESIETSRISHQSGARSTSSTCDNLCARNSRSPSTGVLEDTLDTEKGPQPEDIHEARTVGDSEGQEAASYRAKDAGNKASCRESLRYGSLGAEERSTATGGRDNRGPANDDRGAAASSLVQALPPAGQSCRVCCHPQADIGGLQQFRSVSENSTIRQADHQTTTMTENTSSRTPGFTSALAHDATREHSGSPQRPQDSSFPPTPGEAQEVFGRGILRIQPHGPRNAYVITFLPDVVQPASMSSTSEMSCEKSSHSTPRGPANPANAPVTGRVPGTQKDLPIDPLILADDGPWEAGDLPQPFSLGDDPKPSEAICPYPDPTPLFSSALGQRDSVVLRQDKDTQFISSPHDRHSVAAGNSTSSNPLGSAHSGRQSKSRKRKPRQPDGQPPKRVRGPHTSAPEGNSFAALHTYFLSLPLDKRLQFLPWLLDGALPLHMPTADLVTTGNGDARPASHLPQRTDSSEPHGSSRKGMPWSSEEVGLLLRLRGDEKRPWSEVTRLFSDQFPGRSQGSIQVFWSTTLKKRAH